MHHHKIVLSIWLSIFLFSTFVEAASTASVRFQVTRIPVCGMTFQRIEMISPSPDWQVASTPTPLGNTGYMIMLPQALEWASDATPKAIATVLSFESLPTLTTEKLLPTLPIYPVEDGNSLVPDLCAWVKTYASTYSKLSPTTLATSLMRVKLSGAQAPVLETVVKAPPLPSAVQSAPSVTLPAPNSPLRYLILTQTNYRPEADQLAQYRNAEGITTKVMNIEQLPGYRTSDPTPSECNAPYDRECYIYPTDFIHPGTYRSVAGLLGVLRPSLDTSAQRLILVSGIIRAYLRTMKTAYPTLKAVLLLGDPEVIPASAYQGGSDVGVGSNFTKGTDYFYSFPFEETHGFDQGRNATTASTMHGKFPCINAQGVSTFRPWCLEGEQMNQAPINHQGPLEMPVKPASYYTTFENYMKIPRIGAAFIIVSRLVTQSKNKPNNHDPGPQNYINKLKWWETHLPPKYGNSILTVGGTENWLYSYDDFANFKANYGATSKVYVSKNYFTSNPNLSAQCPQCQYKNADEILIEMNTQTRTSWVLLGHGNHAVIMAPGNPGVAGAKDLFWTNRSYFIDTFNYAGNRGQIANVENVPSFATFSLFNNPNKLIGHVYANSCDVSSYHQFLDYFNRKISELDPQFNSASFAESLINLPEMGAINTYLNNNVGIGGSDNRVNQVFADQVHQVWKNCGRIGDAVAATRAALNPYFIYQFANRVLMGDPFAKIAAPSASCGGSSNGVSKL